MLDEVEGEGKVGYDYYRCMGQFKEKVIHEKRGGKYKKTERVRVM